MTTDVFDEILEKACRTPVGRLTAAHVAADLQKLAPHFANEATRPQAEAVVQAYIDGPNELRKGMAMAWLARARAMITPAVKTAAAAVRAAPAKIEGKVSDIGAAAGELVARSPIGRKSLAEASEKGGAAARERMAARLAPNSRNPQAARRAPGFLEPSDAIPPRVAADAPKKFQMGFIDEGHRNFGAEQRFRSGHGSGGLQSAAAGAAAGHQAALDGAFRAGAKHAAAAHVGAAARQGRVIAKHSFKAGLAIAAGGGGLGALHGSLSEAQLRQRREAAKHSHDGNGAKA